MNENKEQNATNKEKISLVMRHLKGNKRFFLFALLCSMLSMICNALTPQVIKLTVDSILGAELIFPPNWMKALFRIENLQSEPVKALLIASGAILLFAVVSGICGYGQRIYLARASEAFVKRLRDHLFAHIQRLPFAWHTAHQTGDIIQRCTSDVDVIRNFVCNQLMEVVRTVILITLYLSIMFTMQVKLSLISLLFVPLILVSSMVFYQNIATRFRAADEAEGELTNIVQENLTGVRVVRAFGREQFEIDRFDERNEIFTALWIRLGKLLSVFWAMGDLLTSLQVMVIVVVGTLESVNGSLTLGGFLAFVSYNATLTWPVRSLGRVLAEMSKAGVSIDRVGYILNAEEESEDEDAITETVTGDIIFDHVSFGYQEAEVLRDVSFTIPAGTTFAILGGTGSGKSTLVHLLDRLYDLPKGQGRITIGDIEINAFDRRHLRRNIGIVLQEPFLFSKTIHENIAVAHKKVQREEVKRVAGIACVDEAISDFADGYDTVVGERGVTLSGGQKQRVAIARMLIQKAPIMIFDDSLSAVDAETDAKIRTALRENMGESTVIFISHRIPTLMQADRILVLENGRVADLGTHQELIARPGMYKEIYNIQMSSDDRALIEEGGMADVGI